MSDYLDGIFGVAGSLAKKFDGYEVRPGQIKLARAIEKALVGGVFLGEGPCGSGKSFAYLVPALRRAAEGGSHVMVATCNIALQEQLIKKDLPMLQQVLPFPFSFTLLKGRGNFLCPLHGVEAMQEREWESFRDDELKEQGALVTQWAETTETGDKSDIPFRVDQRVWNLFTCDADECPGDKCTERGACWYMAAKDRARLSHVVVINQHMLFAHLMVRMMTGRDMVLPPFDTVIIDEAHEAADIARDFFGVSLSRWSIRRLAKLVGRLGQGAIAESLKEAGDRFFSAVTSYRQQHDYPYLQVSDWVDGSYLSDQLQQVLELQTEDDDDGGAKGMTKLAYRIAGNHHAALTSLIQLGNDNLVCWIDPHGKLHGKCLDVSKLLHSELFEKCRTVIMVSATMAVSGNCSFIRRELGVPVEAEELVVDSPFDFAERARLILPQEMVDPRGDNFVDQATTILRSVIEQAGGRTLGLFTSHRNLRAVADKLGDVGHTVLVQGDLAPSELARRFREDKTSILLGTETFWEGLDVPGDALVALFIDKLPFPNLSDPLMAAIKDRSKSSFGDQMIPRAVMMLRQGVGRLIRTKDDYGVAVLADERLITARYGRDFLSSLPPMPVVEDLREVGRFLEKWRKDAA